MQWSVVLTIPDQADHTCAQRIHGNLLLAEKTETRRLSAAHVKKVRLCHAMPRIRAGFSLKFVFLLETVEG